MWCYGVSTVTAMTAVVLVKRSAVHIRWLVSCLGRAALTVWGWPSTSWPRARSDAAAAGRPALCSTTSSGTSAGHVTSRSPGSFQSPTWFCRAPQRHHNHAPSAQSAAHCQEAGVVPPRVTRDHPDPASGTLIFIQCFNYFLWVCVYITDGQS